jgi:hypothetical protein
MRRSPVGLTAPYRWLAGALALGRAHARLFLFASLALLTVVMVSALLQQVVMRVLPSPALLQTLAMLAVYVVFILLIKPLLEGGFFRMLQAVGQGRAVGRRELFALFDQPLVARRVIRTNLVFTLALLLGVLMPLAAIGGEPLAAWLQALTQLQPGATVLPPMPEGVGSLLAVAMLVGVLIGTARALALCQASLAERAPLAAAGDGLRVALGQSAAFLLFYLPIAVLAFIGLLMAALLAVLMGAVLGLISPVLANLLILPVGLLIGLAVYSLAFGFFFHAWRDTLADDAAAAPPADAPNQIEL